MITAVIAIHVMCMFLYGQWMYSRGRAAGRRSGRSVVFEYRRER